MRLKLLVPVLFLAGFGASYAIASPDAALHLIKTGTTGKPGKVKLCHKTGSKKNPSVTISVSRKALKAHLRHGDTMDACPSRTTSTSDSASTSTSTSTSASTSTTDSKVAICHRTGSPSNPYVKITVSESALDAHRRHGDIVPAPAAGCPTGVSGTTTDMTGGKGKGR